MAKKNQGELLQENHITIKEIQTNKNSPFLYSPYLDYLEESNVQGTKTK